MILFKEKTFLPLSIFIFLPIFYVFGIAIVEISFFLILFLFLIRQKNLLFFRDYKFLFLFFFSIYVAADFLIKYDTYFELSSLLYMRYALLAIAVNYYLSNIKEDKDYVFTKILFLFFSIIIFDSLYQFFSGKNLFGYELIGSRVSSFFKEELILGSFLIKLLPILIWYIFFFDISLQKKKLLFYIFFSAYFFTIFTSGERTSFTLMFLFILLMIFFLKNFRKIVIVSSIFTILAITIVTYKNSGSSTTFYRMFIKPFHQITNYIYTNSKIKVTSLEERKLEKNIVIFSNDHHGHYKLALHLFFKEPIFGLGPRGFRYYCRSVNYSAETGICSTHPHNTFIQILSELGLIGTLFYLFGMFFIINKFIVCLKSSASQRNKDLLIISSIAVILNFFPFLPSGNFFNNWISIINFYTIGFYIFSYNNFFKND